MTIAILARRKSAWTPPKPIKSKPQPIGVVDRLTEHADLISEYLTTAPYNKRANILRRMKKKCGGRTVTHDDVMKAWHKIRPKDADE